LLKWESTYNVTVPYAANMKCQSVRWEGATAYLRTRLKSPS